MQGYLRILDIEAKLDSHYDRIEMTIDKNRDWLTDEKLHANLDALAAHRAEHAQRKARTQDQARVFGLIE